METFSGQLIRRLHECSYHCWRDNYDEMRFGKQEVSLIDSAYDIVKRAARRVGFFRKAKLNFPSLNSWEPLFGDLEWLYQQFQDQKSRQTLVDVISYRLLGHQHVRLATNTPERIARLAAIEKLGSTTDQVPLDFNGWHLQRFELTSLGFPITLYIRPNGVFTQFLLQQYFNSAVDVKVCPGDVVLDCGGCYGESALDFAFHAGESGRVYSFEFVPENANLFEKNCALNPALDSRISLVRNALWNSSGIPVYVVGTGPGASVSFESPEAGSASTVKTITIDDFVAQSALSTVDFIKMDIEGAEFPALKGAEATIRRFRPKLALCVYHSPQDFVRLAKFLDELELGYRFALDHFTIHSEETVLFASVK